MEFKNIDQVIDFIKSENIRYLAESSGGCATLE